MIKPADRLALVSEYYFSNKLRQIASMREAGIDVISLGIGSPDMPPSEETIDCLCEAAHGANMHGYQPCSGIPELRKAFADWYARYYGVELNPANEIQPLIGSKEGILHVTLAFVNPGDEVLVPNPGYPTYTSLSKLLGAKVVYYDLKEENGWFKTPLFEVIPGIVDIVALLFETNTTASIAIILRTIRPVHIYQPFAPQVLSSDIRVE